VLPIANKENHVNKFCALLAAALLVVGPSLTNAKEYKKVDVLLSTGETILGQEFSYPMGSSAEVTAVIVTLLPGEATGWHEHHVPLFGYMLKGELTVNYGDTGRKIYKKGDALMEAIDHGHDGVNTGAGVMRVLTVFMSSKDGVKTEKVPAPGE
jgi:quercetin dioxygenase-like cupin family protein